MKMFILESTLKDSYPEHLKKDLGWGNGYVVISKESPLYNKDEGFFHHHLDVIGGVTYYTYIKEIHLEEYSAFSSSLEPHDIESLILGFDTVHYVCSASIHTKEWVENHTKEMLYQLLDLEKKVRDGEIH